MVVKTEIRVGDIIGYGDVTMEVVQVTSDGSHIVTFHPDEAGTRIVWRATDARTAAGKQIHEPQLTVRRGKQSEKAA